MKPSKYSITSDLFGDVDIPISLEDMQGSIPQYDGWVTTLQSSANGELRLVAERSQEDDDEIEWQNQPSRYDNWTMVTPDYGYLVIGQEIEAS